MALADDLYRCVIFVDIPGCRPDSSGAANQFEFVINLKGIQPAPSKKDCYTA
jgi:hypothetical protein